MDGTLSGGKLAAKHNKEKYGEDFYVRIGGLSKAAWIRNGKKPRGFAAMSTEQRQEAGRRGGIVSKRQKRV